MSFPLPGVCLITGAASGIGRGIALSLAREGSPQLFLADINPKGLEETKHELQIQSPQTQVVTLRVDIAKEADVQQMIEACVIAYGRVDYALNVAGVVPQRIPIADVDIETFEKVVDINEYGTWLCHRAQIGQMLKQEPLPGNAPTRGSIVSISSLSGLNASSGMSTYCASKHAIIGFAKTDAQDYGPDGIRINVICPGMIDTELFRKTSPPDAPAKLAAITPVRRLGRPEDVAALAAFLCSPQASFIQGAVVPCDGGIVLHRGVL